MKKHHQYYYDLRNNWLQAPLKKKTPTYRKFVLSSAFFLKAVLKNSTSGQRTA